MGAGWGPQRSQARQGTLPTSAAVPPLLAPLRALLARAMLLPSIPLTGPAMFSSDLNLAGVLQSLSCPRCDCLCMVQITEEAQAEAVPSDVHRSYGIMDPAVTVRCSCCGLVAEWPALAQD